MEQTLSRDMVRMIAQDSVLNAPGRSALKQWVAKLRIITLWFNAASRLEYVEYVLSQILEEMKPYCQDEFLLEAEQNKLPKTGYCIPTRLIKELRRLNEHH